MLIGLLSDTHVRFSGTRNNLGQLCASELPTQIRDAFQGVDDPFEIANDKRVKQEHFITVDGVTIWLSHYGLWPENSPNKLPDVIVYGHTHQNALENRDGILQINPGSPTFPSYQHTLGTVALLNIKSGKASAELVQLQGQVGGTSAASLQR
jgi:predicted phosphodiesterase